MRCDVERNERYIPWLVIFLAPAAIGAVFASCAAAEDKVGARENDDNGELSTDASVGESDAACEGVPETCVPKPKCEGVEWCPVKTDHPAGLGLSSIWGSGANDVWVVGAAGTTIHWDGNEWKFVPVDTRWSLFAVWGSGPNDIWTVCSPAQIFHTTGFKDGAAQWSLVTPICSGGCRPNWFLRAMWGTSPSDIWVGGDYPIGRPPSYDPESGWRSVASDGGTSWVAMSQFQDSQIKALWGSGPDDVWMVGSKNQSYPLSFSAHTTGIVAANGLPIWTEFDTQTISVLYALWGSGPGDTWTVGDYGTIRHFTADTGAWSAVESPTSEHLRGLWGAASNDIWAVGEHGTLLHYDGTAWRMSTAAFPSGVKPNLYGVWGSGPSDVWAVGSGFIMHFSGFKPDAEGTSQ